MRRPRAKLDGAYYHATSRCAFQTFALDAESKEMFVRMMWRAAEFSGVEVANYCIMDNHFHLLVKVLKRVEVNDAELERRIRVLYGEKKASDILDRWKELSKKGSISALKRERNAFRTRMFDISQFMKTLKQRFSLWYCTHHGNLEGSIWQGRFHSVLVENSQSALSAVSAYIDMNPVRAGVVKDAKSYKWSGLGAACAGNDRAKAGILSLLAESAGEGARKHGWNALAWNHYLEMFGSKDAPEAKETKTRSERQDRLSDGKINIIVRKREARISRGLAFGSAQFVGQSIEKFANTTKTRTHALVFGKWDERILCCAGRKNQLMLNKVKMKE